jgi:hypothetical protein
MVHFSIEVIYHTKAWAFAHDRNREPPCSLDTVDGCASDCRKILSMFRLIHAVGRQIKEENRCALYF